MSLENLPIEPERQLPQIPDPRPRLPIAFDIAPVAHFINERHAIALRKAWLEGVSLPPAYAPVSPLPEARGWMLNHLTDDPILGEYRFCNVFRELDRTTIWIRENIREPFADHPYLWFMLAIARTINWTPTLAMLLNTPGAWPSHPDFAPEKMTDALNQWQDAGNKVYTGAYMIRAESNKRKEWYTWRKNQYIAEIVLGRLWEDRRQLMWLLDYRPTIQRFWMELQRKRFIGWGPFMAGQVTTDLRHTRYFRDAPDRASWAAMGPGSMRGLNRLHGRKLDLPLLQDCAVAEMQAIQEELPNHLAAWVPTVIELTDIQNALCETDKMLRAHNGEGKPRASYVPGRGS